MTRPFDIPSHVETSPAGTRRRSYLLLPSPIVGPRLAPQDTWSNRPNSAAKSHQFAGPPTLPPLPSLPSGLSTRFPRGWKTGLATGNKLASFLIEESQMPGRCELGKPATRSFIIKARETRRLRLAHRKRTTIGRCRGCFLVHKRSLEVCVDSLTHIPVSFYCSPTPLFSRALTPPHPLVGRLFPPRIF